MITHIYGAATLLIKQDSGDAPIFAAMQAGKRADGSDVESKPL